MRQLRRMRAGPTAVAKRMLPTGELTDDLLNYIHGWAKLGYRPNVSSPRSFNEHILASKRRFPGDIELARRLTDKYLFKEWLAEKGLDDLIIPTIGLYNNVEEIQDIVFEENTILKPTHLSGWVLPFHESRNLRVDEISKLKKWLRTDYYRKSREINYKGLRKRLMCEQLLLNSRNEIPMDYKFFMCLGQTLMIQVNIDRFADHMEQLYSTDWELLEARLTFPRSPVPIKRPASLDAALEIASALSCDFPICRVDLYLLPDNVIKAGEITFFPGGGGSKFTPKSADFALGESMRRILQQSPKQEA